MIRTYYTRDRERTIEQLDGVRAVRNADNEWEVVELADPRLSDPNVTKGLICQLGDATMFVTGCITAQFRPDVSREQISRLLAERELIITFQFTFETNLYAIAPTSKDRYDGIAIANELRAIPECQFAEPLFEQRQYVGR